MIREGESPTNHQSTIILSLPPPPINKKLQNCQPIIFWYLSYAVVFFFPAPPSPNLISFLDCQIYENDLSISTAFLLTVLLFSPLNTQEEF